MLEKMTPCPSSAERKARIEEDKELRLQIKADQDAERYKWFLDQSGIDLRQRDKDFMVLKQKQKWLTAYQKTCQITSEGSIAILLLNRGTGKTQCAVEIIKNICRTFKKCLYLRAREINNIMLDMQGDNKREKAVARFVKPYLLVIDEFQDKFDTDFAYKNMNLITDKRHANYKPTIFIANLTVKQIRDVLGPAIVDRVREQGGIIIFDWESFRAKGAKP